MEADLLVHRAFGKSAKINGERCSALDAYRASFTLAQLAAPGTISNSMTPDKVIRVDDPEGKRLAKVDPAYAQRDPPAHPRDRGGAHSSTEDRSELSVVQFVARGAGLYSTRQVTQRVGCVLHEWRGQFHIHHNS